MKKIKDFFNGLGAKTKALVYALAIGTIISIVGIILNECITL